MLDQRTASKRVSDLMQTSIVTASPETTVAEIIITLADAHVSSVPVVDTHRRVLGVVSASDVLVAEAEADDLEARERLATAARASDLMTPNAVTIEPTATVRDAARLMLYAEVHRLFVVLEGRLVGVISTTDIVRAVATAAI